MARAGERPRVVVLGGGFGGAYAAKALAKAAKQNGFDLTVIDRNNFLLFYPLLVEAGVGSLEPRHVVVPLRRIIPKVDFRMAEVRSVDLKTKRVTYQVIGKDVEEHVHFDYLLLALGSVTRTPPLPGLKEYGFGLKSLSDAVMLRDRGIQLMELANTIKDREKQREILRHVVVGASFTGVEFAGEYQAFLMDAAKDYENVRPEDVKMVILEHGHRILPAVRPDLSEWAERTLCARGIEIMPETTITEIGPDYAMLTNGQRLPTRTVLWAAGIAPSPLLSKIEGLPLNVKGYVDTDRNLRVQGVENVWAVGDCATVRDKNGAIYAATSQNAVRMGPLAARNIVAALNGGQMEEFNYKPLGAYAAIGHRVAAADVFGKSVKGFLGWFLYRGTYLMKMPTLALKLRLAMDWLLELVLASESVQLGVHRLRREEPKPMAPSAELPKEP